MERLFALVAICLVAVGCDSEGDSDAAATNHGFGWHFEAQAANGLALRHEPGVVEPVDIAVLADIYEQTQACTGISAPAPFVIVVPERVDATGHPGGPANGLFFYQPPLILITQGWTWTDAARHEFVHYLLAWSGFPLQNNSAHDSPFFTDCVHSVALELF
ncbi:MAG: hypothetical protein ACE5LB_03230 [Acidiferrobacterales bacterium]